VILQKAVSVNVRELRRGKILLDNNLDSAEMVVLVAEHSIVGGIE
jgi:hypothetical protein